MQLIYVAGRYRANTEEKVKLQIGAAKMTGVILAEKGFYPVIPHLNTEGFEHLCNQGDEFYINGTLELMSRCDAVVLVPGWDSSEGTKGEITKAEELGIPVFMTVEKFLLRHAK